MVLRRNINVVLFHAKHWIRGFVNRRTHCEPSDILTFDILTFKHLKPILSDVDLAIIYYDFDKKGNLNEGREYVSTLWM